MDTRERNQAVMEASRIETTRGMIGDLLLSGEQLRDDPSLKGAHGRDECQAFQLIRVFGTHNLLNRLQRPEHDATADPC